MSSYDPAAVLEAVRACLAPLGGMAEFVKAGQTVLLKPNLISAFSPERAATTHPAIVRAAAVLVQEAGGRAVVGDSPGIGDLGFVMRKTGLAAALEPLGVEKADFQNTVEFEELQNRVGKKLALAKAVADVDLIITLPKLKTHSQMSFTGALKNQYGLVVGARKGHYHYRLGSREWLAALMIDINRIAKPALAIMDAIVGMEGPGPAGGDPRNIGAVMASSDLTALDVVACGVIGLDPGVVPLIQAARKYGFGTGRMEDIQVAGAPLEAIAVPDFKKVPELSNVLRLLPLPPAVLNWIRRTWAPKPRIAAVRCIKCGDCRRGCPVAPAAINPFAEDGRHVDDKRCIRCYCCHEFCPAKAIELKRTLIHRLLHT